MLTTMDAESHWDRWQRVIGGDEVDATEVLALAAMYERYFQEIQSRAVHVLRREGRTWQEIADAVGVTKQTAWQKWRTSAEKSKEFAERLVDFPRFARP
jgi:hypothetical protein